MSTRAYWLVVAGLALAFSVILMLGVLWMWDPMRSPGPALLLIAGSIAFFALQFWLPKGWRLLSALILAALVPAVDFVVHWMPLAAKLGIGEEPQLPRFIVDLEIWLFAGLPYAVVALLFPRPPLARVLRQYLATSHITSN